MANLLVIGGTGFFGKSILDGFQRGLLDAWGIETIDVMARHTKEFKEKHANLINDRVKFHTLDITKCNTLPKAEYVIHAAASTDASKYMLASKKEQENILAATKNYCRLAKKYHQESKIVYVSSGAVYGPQPYDLIEIPEELAFHASLDAMPINKIGYAAAKRDCEKMIMDLAQYEIKVSVARSFAFIGKYLPLDQHFAVGNFLRDGLAGRPINIKAKNKVYRSYMYADDLVEWLLSIGQLASESCPIFNVGSSQSISIDELAEKIGKKFNTNVMGYECLSSDVDRYIPSIRRANEYNITQKYDLDQAIDKTIALLAPCGLRSVES
jgi:dTDP-glucose 4,6-dehydratase